MEDRPRMVVKNEGGSLWRVSPSLWRICDVDVSYSEWKSRGDLSLRSKDGSGSEPRMGLLRRNLYEKWYAIVEEFSFTTTIQDNGLTPRHVCACS